MSCISGTPVLPCHSHAGKGGREGGEGREGGGKVGRGGKKRKSGEKRDDGEGKEGIEIRAHRKKGVG